MPPIDHFLNNHAQYYSTYDFKRILEIAGFELQKLVLVKERVLLAEGINEVPVLKAAIVDT